MTTRLVRVCGVICAGAATAWGQWDVVAEYRPPDGAERSYEFAKSLSLQGGRLAVGGRGIASDGWNLGSVFTYTRSSGEWAEGPKIRHAGVSTYSKFASAVAVQGEHILVGAFGHDLPREDAGIVSHFQFVADEWVLVEELVPSSGTRYDQWFGYAIAADDGSRVIVGAPSDRKHAPDQGAAFVFERSDGRYRQVARLEASNGGEDEYFGGTCVISGDVAAAAATGKYEPDVAWGSVYVFEYDGRSWQETAELVQPPHVPPMNEDFGEALALDGNTLVVGAPVAAVDGLTSAGKVYVYERVETGAWEFVQELSAGVPEAYAWFGKTVDLVGDRMVVGAPHEDNIERREGAAYVFVRQDGAWTLLQRLSNPDVENGSDFGEPVAVDGKSLVVGARQSSPVGAVYVFEAPSTCVPDWNEDGTVNSQDFLAYLNDWVIDEPEADLTEDGNVDTRDFLVFMNLWVAGC